MIKPDLNKPAFASGIMSKEAVEAEQCTYCGITIREEHFRDPISKQEYAISGLCQECQDDVFE